MKNEFYSRTLENRYGEDCFNQRTMERRIPKEVMQTFRKVQDGKEKLQPEIAEIIAGAMKDWAIERGATHYTHWFQPLTGFTAEKHDSFISPGPGGRIIMEFSGKELVQGEPDASSFPSGGLRATFEARGYTAWDTSSPAFLKQDKGGLTLCIPTAFVSYTGEALDKKVPLLRSMDAVQKQTLRVLRLLGNKSSRRVVPQIGPEQEYFLIDRKYFDKRPDLLLSGRTLYGRMAAKGQELDDHYFGTIKDRVAQYMRELNIALWKLGISAKTQHNEVAPNQFELATVYSSANVATDTNQLVMETMKKVALPLGLVCLLHEKPFAGVNGSGKHDNWSLNTDDGINLLKPGKNPQDNAQFLLFLVSIIKAVDQYAELLRLSAANAGNDHRLGANEAPPAIISIFLGEMLQNILEKLSRGELVESREGGRLMLGSTSLPELPQDLSDRNRTSPFAFTGNKFEFRMVGSSQSLAGPNVVLNTAVAEILSEVADRLEKADQVHEEITAIVAEFYKKHKRVVFNGNGYSEEWIEEAEKRGLPNITSTVDALPELLSKKSIKLFETHSVLSRNELESRLKIYLESYCKQLNIEAGIMVEMARTQILPAVMEYISRIGITAKEVHALQIREWHTPKKMLDKLIADLDGFYEALEELEALIPQVQAIEGAYESGRGCRDLIVPAMKQLRAFADSMEEQVDRDLWPFPRYEEMLFCL